MAKTKAQITQISCAVTAQLICAFVFAYAKSRFSHDRLNILEHTCVYRLLLLAAISSFSLISQTGCSSLVYKEYEGRLESM